MIPHKDIVLVMVLCGMCILSIGSCSDDEALFFAPTPRYRLLDESPAWSSDETRIIYRHNGITAFNESGNYDIDPDSVGLWMMNSDGTNHHLILRDGRNAQWSSDGEWIVYNVGQQIYKARVLLDQIDTVSIEQLTFNGNNFCPAWCPVDSWITYDSDMPSGGPYLIWKMKQDGSSKSLLHEDARGSDWSITGELISIHKYVNDKDIEIFTIDTLGLNPIQITFNGSLKGHAQYSPDVNRIAYIHSPGNGVSELVIHDLDTHEDNSIVDNVGFAGLSWSPDGSRIVFSRMNSVDMKSHGTLWVVNVDGSGLTQLTPSLQ